jgi:hypothetical protein
MQSNHRRPHCHTRNVYDHSCVVALVASRVLFFRPPSLVASYGSPPSFARGSIVTSKTKTWHASSTCLGSRSICSFDAPFPLPTTFVLIPWVSDTHKTVYSGWKIPLPLWHAPFGLATSNDYLQANGGAYYNIRFLPFLLVTSFREHDGRLHEESLCSTKSRAARTGSSTCSVSSAQPRMGGGTSTVEWV